MIEKNGE